jgi:hypothetical protein
VGTETVSAGEVSTVERFGARRRVGAAPAADTDGSEAVVRFFAIMIYFSVGLFV